MNCYLCKSDRTHLVQGYTNPDKYMMSAGIDKGWVWYICSNCGLYFQPEPLKANELMAVYANYRDPSMRGTTVEEEFDRIMNLPPQDSENEYRFRWFGNHYEGPGNMLDIGSGLGVWPYYIKTCLNFNIECIEPNSQSAKFINDALNIHCYPGFFQAHLYNNKGFDVVSLIHILEHMLDPIGFCEEIKTVLGDKGHLFIEVPDAVEFTYLPIDHDEYNSCHNFFFTVQTLSTTLEKAGYSIKDIHRVRHESRNLSRILMLCSLQ